ncbi:DNA-binding response regulator [Polycladomyces abyssicola]|jgi:two-component system, OmpR family, response regulator|uniref:DNA-binding response regulator n=1 Tax=Polycladomyces abyssicola TaxID=1125966 RepID=A0A8D5UFR5_9BACL|nr:response regulator transcription factor [Polycladomyces abyssicola]BCU82691.1 DNA-binding response regulator [Polycladomyces abyssicola]
MRILVAEDDSAVCEMLSLFFDKEGFTAQFVHDGQTAWEIWKSQPFDLLILDWMLPKMDGITICQRVRRESDVPIILLTARTQESDQVLGLEIGADDYVTKPFSPLALMARIKAIRRRCYLKEDDTEGDWIRTRHFAVRCETREVWRDGVKIEQLTPREFDLLCHFLRHPRRVFSREELLDAVWGYDFYGDERTVDAHIRRLRKKIAVPGKEWIHTVWGVGYKWEDAEADEKR